MAIDLSLNNYLIVRAAWTAMDQSYGVVITGDTLHAIDNSGNFRPQPFATPSGYVARRLG